MGGQTVEVPAERPRDRWKSRPVLAVALRSLILLVPIGFSLATTALVRLFLPSPHGFLPTLGWWACLLAVGVGTAVLVERQARRLLPIVTLLKLSMLFPDRAPSRFAVAKQAGSVRGLQARLKELENLPEASQESSSAATILALVTALQSHDRRTRGHAERVRVFTDLLGEEMKLPAEDRYRLRWAALLHDIGKMTVEARVLNKSGKLTEEEWAVMRTHPSEGARIAAPLLDWLGPWGGAIEDHHERFDGGGYPNGVAGEGISLAGRIVAVADSYDTMTAVRTYKKPMAVWAARAELARCAGGQFDPVVVRAFFAISLPKLLWKTGPLSFLVQIPFLARLQELGAQGLAVAGQGAVASVVVGATALTLAGIPGGADVHGRVAPGPVAAARPGAAASSHTGGPGGLTAGPGIGGQKPSARRSPSSSSPSGGPSPAPRGLAGSPAPFPSPSSGTPSPVPQPSPTGSPVPSPSPSPSPSKPAPLPSLPLPTPSLPIPLPSVSLPPLPTPSVSLPVPPSSDEKRE